MTKIKDFILLAQIDEDINEIESSQGDLPSRIKKLELTKDNLEKNKTLYSSKESEASSSKKDLLQEKDTYSQKLEKYKDQLFLVKNNREYDALNSEIDLAKEELFKINESLKSIESEELEFSEKNKLNESELEECVAKLNELNSSLSDSINDYKDKYEKLKSDRNKIIEKADVAILGSYNKMLKAKGHGMVPMLNNSCGSCFTVLPAQLVTEVKQNLDFKNCPSCNILLYYEEE